MALLFEEAGEKRATCPSAPSEGVITGSRDSVLTCHHANRTGEPHQSGELGLGPHELKCRLKVQDPALLRLMEHYRLLI